MKIKEDHLKNLLPQVQEVFEKSNLERMNFIREEKWITYPNATKIHDRMKILLTYPKKSRMPGMLLVGETNNGKSSIIKRFKKLNEYKNEEGILEVTQIPIVIVQAPPSPDLGYFYSNILNCFAVPFRNTDKISKKEQQVKYYLGAANTKLLIIDEIHNILSGPISKQKIFMNAIKNLSNDLQISIVLVGIKDALHATNTDTQISNRFKPEFLSKWKLDNDFLSLLASIEKTLPLKKASNIATTKEIALCILDLSEGYIGEIIDLITTASEYAINNNIERINQKVLNSCGFISPSRRKNYDEIIAL
ncbi:TniB family NTP-binding protein [Poseidonibacter ostreae]|uniref:AAA family ATPase n=1 Tax=Poseidonibacter ostreae TaxID=2654171 RepID=A0A6L4WXM7_9BACT|nr:TniB family NTP-binding protein [Poseidonibacter ostreae]KAB7890288.1 AAA family ATPase [Poseidonibacter ostreae]